MLFKNVWIAPFLPIPIYLLKACIKINFGVGKLLYVLSHTVFLSIYIFTKVDQFTEPYRSVHFKIHNAIVWVTRSQKTKEGVRNCKENNQRISTCLKEKQKEKKKKAKKTSLLGLANYYTYF